MVPRIHEIKIIKVLIKVNFSKLTFESFFKRVLLITKFNPNKIRTPIKPINTNGINLWKYVEGRLCLNINHSSFVPKNINLAPKPKIKEPIPQRIKFNVITLFFILNFEFIVRLFIVMDAYA